MPSFMFCVIVLLEDPDMSEAPAGYINMLEAPGVMIISGTSKEFKLGWIGKSMLYECKAFLDNFSIHPFVCSFK